MNIIIIDFKGKRRGKNAKKPAALGFDIAEDVYIRGSVADMEELVELLTLYYWPTMYVTRLLC